VKVGGEIDVPPVVQCSTCDHTRRIVQPRRGRVLAVAGCQIARCCSAITRHDVHVLRAIKDEVFTVEPRKERLNLARRHPRCVIFGVTLVLGARSKSNPLATRRPLDGADAVGHRGDGANLSTWPNGDDAQRGLALLFAAPAREGQPRAVWRPTWVAVALLARSERSWGSGTVGCGQPHL
jgi:hypothetical protein